MPEQNNRNTGPTQSLPSAFQSMRKVALCGAVVVAVFFGGLGGWAAVAPLESAAIASGVLSVESQRKTIQHLEGGIVAEILIRDGERVEAGQALLRLDETQARANLEQLRSRLHAALALEARLVAERDGLERIVFPEALASELPNQKIYDTLAGEESIFNVRRKALDGQAAILGQRIAQYEQEIEGLKGQIHAETTELGLIREELAGHQALVEKKLSGKQRLIELKRDEAAVLGARSKNVAAIARVEQNIAEEKLKILELATTRNNEVVETLRETQTQLSDIAERIRAADHVLSRTWISSPLAGIIVNLRVHTVGGVISPGEALMDIVPVGERLIVEAQVTPEDIDSVYPGLTAQVALTAFDRRNVPPVEGSVISVSADRLTDERTGFPYFLARIALPDDPGPDYRGLEFYPGMQAEVMIITGESTALDYVFRPIKRSFGRALREQ